MMNCIMIFPINTVLITGLENFQCNILFHKAYSLQNRFVLGFFKCLFDNYRQQATCHHDSFAGVKTNENGLFLYHSMEPNHVIRGRLLDYGLLIMFLGVVTGANPYLILPLAFMSLFVPRKLACNEYLTFHAELLPHTE